MEPSNLSEPLNPRPSLQRQSSIQQISTFAQIGNRLTVFLSTSAIALGFIFIGLMILSEKPQCDTGLVLWLQCFLCLEAGFVLLQAVAFCTGEVKATMVCFMCPLGLSGLVLMIVGNFPLYKSKECDESLWTFVFVIMVFFYLVLGIVCCCCCCFCCAGAAMLKNLQQATEEETRQRSQEEAQNPNQQTAGPNP